MKATSIHQVEKLEDGSTVKVKLETSELETLCKYIKAHMDKSGFITDVDQVSSSAIKIGLHMCSFRINTEIHGHNARHNRWTRSPKGYKRTNVPTWDQRVHFNHIVNNAFDKFGLKASIVSGAYTIRTVRGGRVHSWNEGGDLSTGWSGDASVEILPEVEMRKCLDSDRLEADHKEATREARQEKSRAYRAHVKALNQARFVAVSLRLDYTKPRETKVLSHKEIQRLSKRLSQWEVRRSLSRSALIPLPGKTRAEALQALKVLQQKHLELVKGA